MIRLISVLAIPICFCFESFGQDFKINDTKPLEPQIREYLKNVKRDSTDKTCQKLLTDFYECFESDEGQANPKMIQPVMNQIKYKDDINLPNRQLAILLYQYTTSVSEPSNALIWIRALKEEYFKVYSKTHPLIFLYEGESLINSGHESDAHTHFLKFQKLYPESVTALCYIYQTETDKNFAKTWLSILKKEHPDHWIVKMYK